MNTHELAWAAGLFDGEGHAENATKNKPRRDARCPRLSIANTDETLLKRFHDAVRGLGKIYGPYKPKGVNRKPAWSWFVGSFEYVQAVICLLWPWLSRAKKAQYSLALTAYIKAIRSPKIKRQRCKWGHEFDGWKSYKGYQRCRVCENARNRKYYWGRKEKQANIEPAARPWE